MRRKLVPSEVGTGRAIGGAIARIHARTVDWAERVMGTATKAERDFGGEGCHVAVAPWQVGGVHGATHGFTW